MEDVINRQLHSKLSQIESESIKELKNGRLSEQYLRVPHRMTQDKAKSESLAKERILKRSLTEPGNMVKKE